MLNYDEMVARTAAHRDLLLTNAEQQRLAQLLTAASPHPVSAWIGHLLIWWGQRWQRAKPLSLLPAEPMTESL